MSAWIRILILFGMAWMLISLLLTNQLSLLVHPRFQIWTYLSIILFILLGWIQVLHLKKPSLYRTSAWGYILLLLPIIGYLIIPPKALDTSMGNKKGLLLTQAKQKEDRSPTTTSPKVENRTDDPNLRTIYQMQKENLIQIDDRHFANQISAISSYPQMLVGKKIRIKGFIYRDPDSLSPQQFIVGRFTLTCCVADATVIGLMAESEETKPFQANQWFEITGILSTTRLFQQSAPMIKVQSYRQIPALKDPYVYFS